MTTLGALFVGVLLLLLLLGVLAWRQRLPRRGPEQPSTVADLVRMRNAARSVPDPTKFAPPVGAVVSAAEFTGSAERGPDGWSASTAVSQDVGDLPGLAFPDLDADDGDERLPAAAGRAVGAPLSVLDDAAVDTPWARAARMAEPRRGRRAGPPSPSRPRLAPLPAPARAEPASPERARLPSSVADPATSPHNGLADPAEHLRTPAVDLVQLADVPTEQVDAQALLGPTVRSALPVADSAGPSDVSSPSAPAPASTLPATDVETGPTASSTTPPDPQASTGEADPAESAGAAALEAASPTEQPVISGALAPAVSATVAADVPVDARPTGTYAASPLGAPAAPPIAASAASAIARSAASGTVACANLTTAPSTGPAPSAGRVRRSRTATVGEQTATDLALLRTFGAWLDRATAANEPEVELTSCAADDDQPVEGPAEPITFRVMTRDGRGIPTATVTLLDDHGRAAATTRTDPDGNGVLTARHRGGYLLVAAADGYQPAAITVAVSDEPLDAEILLTRSASIAGTVGGEHGPILGAQLVLVQDGEIVDTAQSADDGTYRFPDLAAGEYGMSVSAHEYGSVALVLELAKEADMRHNVDLLPRPTTW